MGQYQESPSTGELESWGRSAEEKAQTNDSWWKDELRAADTQNEKARENLQVCVK